MPQSAVVSIDTGKSLDTFQDRFTSVNKKEPVSVSLISVGAERSEKYIVLGPNELYSFSDDDDAAIFQGIQLLTRCTGILLAAQQINPEEDYIGFDENMMQLRATLRGLFALRTLGDGFASVVNAVLWSLKNKDTETLDKKQLSSILEAVSELKRKPLMHFDTAMSIVDQLEETGLIVEPSMLDELVSSE